MTRKTAKTYNPDEDPNTTRQDSGAEPGDEPPKPEPQTSPNRRQGQDDEGNSGGAHVDVSVDTGDDG